MSQKTNTDRISEFFENYSINDINRKKLIIGLVILLFLPRSITFISYSDGHCNVFYFGSSVYNGRAPLSSDECIGLEPEFNMEFFWKNFHFDTIKFPEFDKAFDSKYEINGLNVYSGYMWAWLTFFGLIAYVMLQFFASFRNISLSSDILMILIAVGNFTYFLNRMYYYNELSYFTGYFIIPVVVIACAITGILGLKETGVFSSITDKSGKIPEKDVSVYPATEPIVACHSCELRIPQSASFCKGCGSKRIMDVDTLVQTTEHEIYCDACGLKMPQSAKFCNDCGEKVS